MEKINRLPHLGFLLTTACNLNCRNCADLIPYRPIIKYDKENVIGDLDKILRVVNKLDQVLLIGGETLLHQDLKYLMKYCLNQSQIGRVIITTNGTIMPDEELFELLQNQRALLRLSGYPENVTPDRHKIVAEVKRRNIHCENMEGMQWRSMGDNRKRNHSLQELQEVWRKCGMRSCVCCTPEGRLFFCSRQLAAYYTPDYPSPFAYETVDVRNLSEHDLFHALWHMYRLDYISTCDYCDGLNAASPVVPTARQILPKEEYVKLLDIMVSLSVDEKAEMKLAKLHEFLEVIQRNKNSLAYEPECEKFYRIIALCEIHDGELFYEGKVFDAYEFCKSLVARLWQDYRYVFPGEITSDSSHAVKSYKRKNIIRFALNESGNAISDADMVLSRSGLNIIMDIRKNGCWVTYE